MWLNLGPAKASGTGPLGTVRTCLGVVASLWSKQLVITHMPSPVLSWPPAG